MSAQTRRIKDALQQAARAGTYEDFEDTQAIIVTFLRAYAGDRETICSLDDLADDVEALDDE